MSKVNITTSDPVTYYLYDEKESAEVFGEDYILDFGEELPEELIQRFKINHAEFWAIQEEIRKYRKDK